MEANNSCEISRLPQDLEAHVISLTSPRDAYRCSAVSTDFRLAAGADAVWEHFLPPDLDHILSRTEDEVVLTPKKDLYFRLSNRAIILDNGCLSFRLDRSSGAKIYMISASRSTLMSIKWDDDDEKYWQRESLNPDSRFLAVARLNFVWSLHITARFSCQNLTPKTNYAAYFVFKLEGHAKGFDRPIVAKVAFGKQMSQNNICLQPRSSSTRPTPQNLIRYPQVRVDDWSEIEIGLRVDDWSEIEIGEFYNDGEDDGYVKMEVIEGTASRTKRGLLFDGIELRPKKEPIA